MGKRGRKPYDDILTPREWEVLGCLRERISNAEIAERPGISIDGVKFHVSEILSKLGLSSREEAAAWRPTGRERTWAGFLPLITKVGLAAAAVASIAGLALLAWSLLPLGGSQSEALPGQSSATPDLAAAAATGWQCFPVGIYEHAICRSSNGTLVLDDLGVVDATQEKAYPNCPEGWIRRDDLAFCLPPSGRTVNPDAGGVRSAAGSTVVVTKEPINVQPQNCDPVYVFGIVHGPTTVMQWCLQAGTAYATINVAAGTATDEYYTAFQVALSAVRP